jgi:hypothetical protein
VIPRCYTTRNVLVRSRDIQRKKKIKRAPHPFRSSSNECSVPKPHRQ